jgi:hypothetical protein
MENGDFGPADEDYTGEYNIWFWVDIEQMKTIPVSITSGFGWTLRFYGNDKPSVSRGHE